MSRFCKEAVAISHMCQYGEATRKQRWKLRFHLLICKACAGFTRRNDRLTQLCEHAHLQQLSEADKAEMKRRMHLHGNP